ncbi:hypothetical protein J7L68_02015 [bacterium]|nr:hypothetical protein [bacterium]
MSFVSCEPFPVSFIVVDTTHIDSPDPSELYFTIEVNGLDTTVTSPPVLDISGTTDSLYITVNPIWSEGDSVIVTLDSIFTIRGCKTIP